jgi:hypothetical protein
MLESLCMVSGRKLGLICIVTNGLDCCVHARCLVRVMVQAGSCSDVLQQ